MALVLREADVRAVLTMPDVISALEGAFRRQAHGQARNVPRSRIVLPDGRGVMHLLAAYLPGQPGQPDQDGPGVLGYKAYTAFHGGVRFVVMLYSADDGRLLAVIEADWLGQMRTGAASGVATRFMARQDAGVLGMIGTGSQARTQALAVAAVRSLSRAYVYGRDERRRVAFCADLSAATGIECVPVASAEAAVRPADILVTATTAREPVMHADWLRAGTHINAMGSNWHNRREVDDDTVEHSAVVAVDDLEQARLEAGDLLIPEAEGRFDFDRVLPLSSIVAGQAAGRTSPQDVTLFKSLGIALEDLAAAGLVYVRACERGLGQDLDILP
jgi:ornithine cyclodeaminase/alanine dehydrogenase-like protein (mu-crystallin family)